MGNGCVVYQKTCNGGTNFSSSYLPQRKTDEEILYSRKATVLILGTAESGKSTLCRHMRQLYGNKFDDDELLKFKNEIQSSCLQYFKNIIHEMLKEEKISAQNKDKCENFIEEFENIGPEYDKFYYLERVMLIWSIVSVQQFILEKITRNDVAEIDRKLYMTSNAKGNTFDDMYSDNPAIHFLISFDRIMSKDYEPSLDDILNLRSPTKALVKTEFKRDEKIIQLIDVGGQRSQRKKWLVLFDGVNVVLFVVAMSEYDQMLLEDDQVNRMQESLRVFAEICDCPFLASSHFLLFLNKKDVFDEKIAFSPITNCFPEYDGGDDKNSAAIFVRQRYRNQNKHEREVYSHYTNAKDTQTVKVIYQVMMDTILLTTLQGIRMD